jgi:ATP-binding cassette subfamily B protein
VIGALPCTEASVGEWVSWQIHTRTGGFTHWWTLSARSMGTTVSGVRGRRERWIDRSLPPGVAATVRTLPDVGLPLSIALVATTILTGLVAIGYIIATKYLIDRLVTGDRHFALPAVAAAVVCGLFLLSETITPFFTAAAETYGYWINRHLRIRLMKASLAPMGIAHLEDKDNLDRLDQAVRLGASGMTPGAAVAGFAMVSRNYVQAVGCAAVLAAYRWWLGPVALLLCVLISRILVADFLRAMEVLSGRHADLRRANYFRSVTIDPALSFELRLFQLGPWMLDRFRHLWTEAMTEVWKERRPRAGRMVAGIAILSTGIAWATWSLATSLRDRVISPGDFVMFGQAILGFLPMFTISMRHLNVANGSRVMDDVTMFEQRTMQFTPLVRQAATSPVPETGDVIFDNVFFSYPGSRDHALRGTSFRITHGTSTAVVGLNGAGKTTLIKLLLRLYDPSAGTITFGGHPISDFDTGEWRKRIAVMFQDYLRFPFSAEENIALGSVESRRDLEHLQLAATAANADAVIRSLRDEWSTRLARGYRDGVDISGGQWQRIATARSFYRLDHGASILVLDEPTASLDIRAEAAFFERFHEVENVTRVLITHRLATVRFVDQILLVDGGVVRECGSHAQLMDQDGAYAHLFRLQKEQLLR